MNLTKKDIVIAGIIFLFSAFIGAGFMALIKHDKVIIQQPNVSKYKKSQDSLVDLIKISQDSNAIYRKHIFYTDSLILVNRKTLNHDKELIKNFTVNSRKRYLDSLFKSAGL